jgi:hypothetical protein
MDYINRFIIMVVKKEISKADQQLYQLVENDVKFILAGREMPYIYRDPPFFI